MTSARHPSRSPLAIQSTAFRSNSPGRDRARRTGGVRQLQGEVPGPDDRDPLVRRPGLHHLPERPAELDEPLRLRQQRREDVRVDRHDRQVGVGAQGDDRASDAVVDPQLVAEREVEAVVEPVAQDVRGELLLPGNVIRGRPNSRSSLYQLASKYGALPTRNCGMLSSQSWWKWSLPITSTSGRALVSVSRKASIFATHSSANGGRLSPCWCLRGSRRVVRRGDDRGDGCHGVLLFRMGQSACLSAGST